MFKKLLNLIKINKGDNTEKEAIEVDKVEQLTTDENIGNDKVEELVEEDINENNETKNDTEKEIEVIDSIENDNNEISIIEKELDTIETVDNTDYENINTKDIIAENKKESLEGNVEIYEPTEEELEYIENMKIERGKTIKAIDVYSNEQTIFDTHSECSKKLGVPLDYIKENLKYGYTDYFGEAINYLSKKLKVNIDELKNEGKNIVEIFNYLHNQIWSEDISENIREEILCSEKIESIKMHYKFETIDDEYDKYLRKYLKIIRRGGKKKIELIDKKNEVIEVFKSLDECAKYFNKDKSEIVDRLKYYNCKIGRYEIRYSLTR